MGGMAGASQGRKNSDRIFFEHQVSGSSSDLRGKDQHPCPQAHLNGLPNCETGNTSLGEEVGN